MASGNGSRGGSVRLAIDNVVDRAWWEDVALGSPNGVRKFNPHDKVLQNPCWFWVSETRTRIFSRVGRGEPPRNALFWHLRNEEWAERPDYARLRHNGRCDSSSCINPWHWTYSLASSSPTLSGAALLDSIRQKIREGTDYTTHRKDYRMALTWYIMLLEGEETERACTVINPRNGKPESGRESVSLMTLLDVDGGTSVDTTSETYISSVEEFPKYPIAVALLEQMVADLVEERDGYMTLDEAFHARGEVLREMFAERQERVATRNAAIFAQRPDDDDEDDREERDPWELTKRDLAMLERDRAAAANPAKPRVKPKPKRVNA